MWFDSHANYILRISLIFLKTVDAIFDIKVLKLGTCNKIMQRFDVDMQPA